MAQNDFAIPNQGGQAFRLDVQDALQSLAGHSSGATDPNTSVGTTYPYQFWADTNNSVMKMRNGADSDWIELFQLDGEWSTIAFENGTAAAPSIYFKDSGTDTGFYSPGADQVGISTGGTSALVVDASQRVGIGTATPSDTLELSSSLPGLTWTDTTNSGKTRVYLDDYIYTVAVDAANAISESALAIRIDNSERARIDSSGNVGIGTASPVTQCTVYGSASAIQFQNTNTGSASGDGFYVGNYGGLSAQVWQYENDVILFGTNNTEAARIDSSGRLLVGTSAVPTATTVEDALVVIEGNSGGNPTGGGSLVLSRGSTVTSTGQFLGEIHFADTGAGYFGRIACEVDGAPSAGDYPGRLVFSTTADGASSPTERLRIDSAGSVVLANASAFVAAYIYNTTTGSAANVNVDASGFLRRSTSSIKYKENVQDATHGLTELLQLRPVTYTGKSEADGATVFGGLIAEEVDAVGLSEFVQYAEDGSPDALAYGNMVSLCVKAIQEQQAVIEELQARVAALEAQ